MGKVPLKKDSEFVVGEAKAFDYIMAFIFFILFLYGSASTVSDGISHARTTSYLLLSRMSLTQSQCVLGLGLIGSIMMNLCSLCFCVNIKNR